MDTEDLWVESYQGEILGEVLFGTIAEEEEEPQRRHELEVLTILEHTTKELAEPVFDRLGFDRGDTEATIERAKFVARVSKVSSWEDFLRGGVGVASDYLGKYRQLVELASEPWEKRIAEAYVAHEEALISYFRRAVGDEEGEPLEGVLALPHVVAAMGKAPSP